MADVKDVAKSSKYSYGSRRMKHALNALGHLVGRRKAQSLMREAGIRARYRKSTRSPPTATTISRCSTMYWPGNLPRLSRIRRM